MDRWAIDIDRDDIREARLVRPPEPALAPGEAEFALDLAALTANNVTYAALGAPTPMLGEDAGYWDFYAERGAPGRVPVWGFATAVRSAAEGIAAGDRFYGYWPLASHAVLTPDRVSATGFVEVSARRQRLPALYNAYQRTSALDDIAEADERLWPVWRPLFITGWLVADQLADQRDHGADAVIVTAASSKTALSFAHAMRARGDALRTIALTSPRSADFVRGTGLYDDVVTYNAIAAPDAARAAIVDFANDGALVDRLRRMLGARLALDLVVGFTHWDAAAAARSGGVPRSGFFAPARLAKRGREWGGAGLRDRLSAAWTGFLADAPALVALDERRGGEAALAAWREVVTGAADPRAAILLAR